MRKLLRSYNRLADVIQVLIECMNDGLRRRSEVGDIENRAVGRQHHIVCSIRRVLYNRDDTARSISIPVNLEDVQVAVACYRERDEMKAVQEEMLVICDALCCDRIGIACELDEVPHLLKRRVELS